MKIHLLAGKVLVGNPGLRYFSPEGLFFLFLGMPYDAYCEYCKNIFTKIRISTRFCSKKCSNRNLRKIPVWHKKTGELEQCYVCEKKFKKKSGNHICCSYACRRKREKLKFIEKHGVEGAKIENHLRGKRYRRSVGYIKKLNKNWVNRKIKKSNPRNHPWLARFESRKSN